MIADARALRDALVAKGWVLGEDLSYIEAEGGEHNEQSWGDARRPGAANSLFPPNIMNREHHRWYSPSLGRDMDLLVFGHAGARAIVFPTSMGTFFEWEDRGMIGALAEPARARLAAALLRRQRGRARAGTRSGSGRAIARIAHAQYDAYLRDEVLPLTRQQQSESVSDDDGRELRRVSRHDVRAALSARGRPRRSG